MTAPEQVVLEDAAELAAEVASRLLSTIETLQSSGSAPHICLTGGTIADLIHREVARRGADSGVDWSRVVFWWGDERFVAATSQHRNALQARQAMLDQLPVDPAQVHEVPAADDGRDVETAAAQYAETLANCGAGGFDVLMLGVGPDGHVASLFPGHPALATVGSGTVAVRDSPKPPPQRVSLTFEALNNARSVWIIASGESKADAVAAACRPGPISECPARGVQGSSETLLLVDRAAAAGL